MRGTRAVNIVLDRRRTCPADPLGLLGNLYTKPVRVAGSYQHLDAARPSHVVIAQALDSGQCTQIDPRLIAYVTPVGARGRVFDVASGCTADSTWRGEGQKKVPHVYVQCSPSSHPATASHRIDTHRPNPNDKRCQKISSGFSVACLVFARLARYHSAFSLMSAGLGAWCASAVMAGLARPLGSYFFLMFARWVGLICSSSPRNSAPGTGMPDEYSF